MKNRILTLVMVTVLFAVLLLTSFALILVNFQQIKNTKDELRNINTIIYNFEYDFQKELDLLTDVKINEHSIRFTLINDDGDVLYDTGEEGSENHKDREEVRDAIKYGEAYTTRYSNTKKVKYMYYATKLKDNCVIRTSVPISTVNLLQNGNIKYYVILVLIVIIFSVFLSIRLVRKIVEPVKELESVTLKMANGDYKIRADINSNDELGVLGKSFNNMADELQNKIYEVMEKQKKLESIFNSMESGVIAIDNNKNVISINPCAELILGIKKSIIGQYLMDYINDNDIQLFLENNEENDKELVISYPLERNLKIKKSEVLDGTKKIGKVISFQDITDMKRVELMRSQFVANVSHELKTPLTSIKGFAETLRIVEDVETRNKFLDIIDKESERLTRLINDILVLSNIESNLIADVEEFRPYKVIEEVLGIVKKSADNKNIALEFNDSSSELILGDKDKFHQLALNLIENSIKYAKDSGGLIKILSYDEDKNYCLEIIDDGIGMDKEELSRIFERFYRVDKSRKKGGTGLGLAIVKHIVRSFNGEITVNSELGKGSSFKVTIPYIYT